MPVTICSIKIRRCQQYHHPIGPAAALGMDGRIIGSSVSRKRKFEHRTRRASRFETSAFSFLFLPSWYWECGAGGGHPGVFLQRILQRRQMRPLISGSIDHASDADRARGGPEACSPFS